MAETQTSYANGSFTTSVSIAGSINITPIMRDTLGVFILGIISIILIFELRHMVDLNRKLTQRGCEGDSNCNCHKPGKTSHS